MTTEPEWADWERNWLRSVAGAIRRARDERGLSQGELAERAGVSKGLVVNLESAAGENPRVSSLPTIAILVRIALAVGRPPLELLYPTVPHGEVDIWPGIRTESLVAAQWFSGEITGWEAARIPAAEGSTNDLISAARQYDQLVDQAVEGIQQSLAFLERPLDDTLEEESKIFMLKARKRISELLGEQREALEAITEGIRRAGGVVEGDD